MDTDEIVVRTVLHARKVKYLDFFEACFQAEYAEMLSKISESKPYRFSAAFLESILPLDGQHMFEAALPDGTIAATGVGFEKGDRFYIWGMYVLPRFQRSGLGTLIIKEFCNIASPNSFLEVLVLRESEKAKHFYHKLGFRTFACSDEEVFPGIKMMTDRMECQASSIKS
jgi:ribosomal protein S18 acetylase RimI-like enzyme